MRPNPQDVQLDAIDKAILAELQASGRLSNQDLAGRVHLSPSACLRRVKALEDAGVIDSYVALLDPRTLGLGHGGGHSEAGELQLAVFRDHTGDPCS